MSNFTDGQPVKSLQQLYADIAVAPGQPTGFRSAKVEKRRDPIEELSRPLITYDNQTFFYVGLLYGFCRLDQELAERFREASGARLESRMYLTRQPLLTIKGFEQFAQTKIAHLLSAVTGALVHEFLDFITSQVIVDRPRGSVWRVKMAMVNMPDPHELASGLQPTVVSVPVFVPYRVGMAYVPLEMGGGRRPPLVVAQALPEDLAFEHETKQLLAGNNG